MNMEIAELGAFLEGEWESLSNIFTFETPDLGAQFLSNPTSSSFVAPSTDSDYSYSNPSSILHHNYSISDSHSDNASETTSYFISQATNRYQNDHFSLPNYVTCPMNICMIDQENHAPLASVFHTALNVDELKSPQVSFQEDNESDNNLGSPLNAEVQYKRKSNTSEVGVEGKPKAASKKKARISKDIDKKSIQLKKINSEVESNEGKVEISDDESKASQETSEGEISVSKGKKRASRGTATDPQSLYARRRREKINERLKILQNLVPNGTKVDISTMLEEAVHYVKFLQLQIRLLSSDDFWMYAPIAYNGVDLSLYKRISPFQLP